jgi:hypothetical protein
VANTGVRTPPRLPSQAPAPARGSAAGCQDRGRQVASGRAGHQMVTEVRQRVSRDRSPRDPSTSSASGAGSAWSLRHGSCQPATHRPPIEDRARQEAAEQARQEAAEQAQREAEERSRQMAEEQTVLPHLCLHPARSFLRVRVARRLGPLMSLRPANSATFAVAPAAASAPCPAARRAGGVCDWGK